MSASNVSPRNPLRFLAPDLADDVRVGVDRPDALPELAPEAGVDLLRDVEAPTVDAEAQPVLRRTKQVLAHAAGCRC